MNIYEKLLKAQVELKALKGNITVLVNTSIEVARIYWKL